MKALTLFLVLFLVSVVSVLAQEAGPEPAPWWMQVEEGQSLALKWIGAVTVILTAVIAMISAIWMKVQELKDRMNRATAEKMALQKQVTELAAQLPTPTQPKVALVLLAACMLSASGCANPGSFTFGYTPPPVGMAKDDGVKLARPAR